MSKREILTFLRAFKRALAQGDWEIVQRRADYAQMTEMTPTAIKLTLLALTPRDYVAGPEGDRDRPGEYLWKFRKDDAAVPNLYIKVKLTPQGHAKVISFHPSRYPRRR
ncbi:type II toxin-antitoxin system MqsR family toxin [Levilactobacillus spicheri]|uniref:DUF4258 domain-containing protein n=1 Tax=Levilactobacillus spicheri TaxID=216463 RepID=A0A0F3RVA5_9LACO|nr:type II toxin-antitoxin system MqsR family toxin [Levilactobacillus spicheri]KJW13815.1 hypothetical protein VC81_01135 [Levilactobacillus spicheri]